MKKVLLIIALLQTQSFADCSLPSLIQRIRPNAKWVLRGTDFLGLEWLDSVQSAPTRRDIDTALTDCQNEENLAKQVTTQAKIDLNTATKTDTQRIDAIIKYLGLDK